MSSLLEGAKRLVTRGTDIGVRVNGLESAVQAARGRLDDALLDPADEIVSKAAERLRLSADHTVVALGGATGSGKSSTFNALVGLELASVSVRRPTTSWATACTWGVQGANELLEWLGIPPRHQIVRDSMLDTGREPKDLDGLVLLDMPDHDSTEVAHHLEVDRLVKLADLLVWVLDPQKYADAALHDRFLKPLAAHKDVMLIVLNHIDEVAPERRPGMLADLRRLLDDDGLEGITLLATSAREGIGIDELRHAITSRVADKAATRHRLSTNLSELAASITAVSGDAQPPAFSVRDHAEIRAAVADAAGVPVVVEAVEKATLIRSRRATGWPLTSWMWRFRPDPLKKLQLEVPGGTRDLITAARSSIPDANEVQNARVDTAVRDFSDRLSATLTRPWATAVRKASVSRLPELEARLDRAVAATDLGVAKVPFWTRAVRALQWLLLLSALAGGAWLVALAGISFLKLPDLPDTKVGSVPVPTLLLLGGVGLGIVLAVLCRVLVQRSARRRAQQADARLRKAVDEVTEELVIEPVEAELLAYRLTTEGLRAARG
ncbi:GTPase [Nocardioides marmorisolisilvae]|uniref:ABC transporter n=1 Tax=Nocardioides marmorisolisilvae TaxID=1542737 RepID=A0A3N0DT05_9ACTN|nr:GTPase [Nocardioides marmorisolisilvae]RNL78758.1 ABC transporter [Nocardioides marmorisolisilvae]